MEKNRQKRCRVGVVVAALLAGLVIGFLAGSFTTIKVANSLALLAGLIIGFSAGSFPTIKDAKSLALLAGLIIGVLAGSFLTIKDAKSLAYAREWQRQHADLVQIDEDGTLYANPFASEEDEIVDLKKAAAAAGIEVMVNDDDPANPTLYIVGPSEERMPYSFAIGLPLKYNSDVGGMACIEYKHFIYYEGRREGTACWRNVDTRKDPDILRETFRAVPVMVGEDKVYISARVYLALSAITQEMLIADPTEWAHYRVPRVVFDPEVTVDEIIEMIQQDNSQIIPLEENDRL